jgi:Tfp pilus assembly PilM family ATPase
LAAVVVPRHDGESEEISLRRLTEVLERKGFRGRSAVVAAPLGKVAVELLDLPPRSSGAPLDQIARGEIARAAKLEAGGFEMASWDLPPTSRGTGTTIMCAALRHTDAEARLEAVEAAGLSPIALDVPCLALMREAVGRQTSSAPAADDKILGVLDFGWSAALVVLVHRGRVIYQRLLGEYGQAALHRLVERQFDVPGDIAEHIVRNFASKAGEGSLVETTGSGADPVHAAWVRSTVARHIDDLSAEINASFAYATHRYPGMTSDVLWLCGGGARIPGAVELLTDRLSTNVKLMSAVPEELGGAEMALAAGLARYER